MEEGAMSPSTVPLARLTTLSLMFVLPLMALPAQGAQSHTPPGGMQTHTPPGGMMIASGHSNSNAHRHGAGRHRELRLGDLHSLGLCAFHNLYLGAILCLGD